MVNQLFVTLDGIRDDEAGMLLHELRSIVEALDKVSSAIEVFARYSGGHQTEHGQSEIWIRRPKSLQLYPSGPGYSFAQWTLEPSPDYQTNAESLKARTFDMLLKSNRGEDPDCAKIAANPLSEISGALPRGVALWLGDADNPAKIGIKHTERVVNDKGPRDEALISDLHAIGIRSAALLGPGPSSVDHGDLLYDERGLPK